MRNSFFYLISLFFLISCSRKEQAAVAFYYWKTNFSLSKLEKETLKENAVQKIYIRYFDIDLHPKTKEAFPVSPIHFLEKPSIKEVVPVVFIKNKVMLQSNVDVKKLAKQTLDFVNLINTTNSMACHEIQIDCDWTLNSKDNYLQFMEVFKRMSDKKLSATIRLHQMKYFEKTAIPNVDSGVLMYYNMGTISANTSNSIYERDIARRYVKSLKKYPLILNFALPIFSWGIHIRDNKVIGLRSKMSVSDLQRDKNFTLEGKTNFTVNTSNYRKGTFYKKGDQLKIEAIVEKDLKEMAADLSENSQLRPQEIIFYDLDEFNIKNYEKTIFEQIVSCF